MKKYFQGRPLFPAHLKGEALVTHQGFNNLACFYQSILANECKAICSDKDNRQLFGKNLTGKILCLPKSVGSTTAGAMWYRVAQLNIAPKAMLFSQPIDSLAASGLILVDVWLGKRICTIDQLGNHFLNTVRTGQKVEIGEDGVVTVFKI